MDERLRAAERHRRHPRALPVVFITGHGDEAVRSQALEAGAVDVLFKPIDEEELVAAIEKALRALPAGRGGM